MSEARDVLVVLREELAHARDVLLQADAVHESEPQQTAVLDAAKKVRTTSDALEARIRAPFDQLLLDRTAATFRTAVKQLEQLVNGRQAARQTAPDVKRVLQRVVAHAREIGRLSHQVGADNVGSAIDSLARAEAWVGPQLEGLVALVDTLLYLSRKRLGPPGTDEQINSLVDRASSTAVVTSLHALKDLAQKVRDDPKLLRDRYALDKALEPSSASVVERLTSWFKLDHDGRAKLHAAVSLFTRRLLDRAAAAK